MTGVQTCALPILVEWDMDGQGYSLFKFGEELSAEEMFAMAEEIIDAQ